LLICMDTLSEKPFKQLINRDTIRIFNPF
jgi:hypothetical protein